VKRGDKWFPTFRTTILDRGEKRHMGGGRLFVSNQPRVRIRMRDGERPKRRQDVIIFLGNTRGTNARYYDFTSRVDCCQGPATLRRVRPEIHTAGTEAFLYAS
jgi:hypothetical protein